MESWVPAWHGARFNSLDSIFQYGLKLPGARLPNGISVSVPPGHIPLGKEVGGFENWALAIFVSPSVAYAAHAAYAERVVSDGKEWCCLVNVRVQRGSFTTFPSTVIGHVALDGEPAEPEYRVQSDRNDAIVRVEGDGNCLVVALAFVDTEFLTTTNLSFNQIQDLLDRAL